MIRTLVYIWAVLVTIAVILINRRPKDYRNEEGTQMLNGQHVSTEFDRESADTNDKKVINTVLSAAPTERTDAQEW